MQAMVFKCAANLINAAWNTAWLIQVVDAQQPVATAAANVEVASEGAE